MVLLTVACMRYRFVQVALQTDHIVSHDVKNLQGGKMA